MSKKRKGKKKRHAATTATVAGPLNATEWRAKLNAFTQTASWQDAISTALDVHQIGDRAQQEDAHRCAAVAEAALRELMELGRENRFRSLTEKILARYPEWIRQWPLGLQVAGRSVPDLAGQLGDPAFAERLRLEIWDPMEPAWSEHPELRRDADHLIKAWDRIERRDFSGARRILEGIRRQSALIDWRLLLQAKMAAHIQDDAGTKAAIQRMNPLAPARRIAALLLPSGAVQPASPALASLQSFIQRPTLRADMEKTVQKASGTDAASLRRVADQVITWHRAGRHELAGAVCVSFGDRDAADEELVPNLLRALETVDPRLSARCSLRAITGAGAASAEFQVQAIASVYFNERLKWSQHEHAIIGLLLCRGLWALGAESSASVTGSEWDEREELMDPELLVDVSRKALTKWPELDDLYELWIRAEQELPHNPCEALSHWARMDPGNVHVLIRCIEDLIANGRCKRAAAALSKLQRFPGEQRQYQALREKLLLAQCEEAYKNNKPSFIQEALGQLNGISAPAANRIRALHVLLSRPNAKTAELYAELETIFDNPWEILFTILRAAGNQGLDDHLKAMAPLIRHDADELAQKWLEVARANSRAAILCGMLPPLRKMLDMVLKNIKRPALVFEVVFQMIQQTFAMPRILFMARIDTSEGQMVASSMWLTRCGEEEWVPVGFGLAGSILLHRALENDYVVYDRFPRALDVLFGAMRSHPCQGPATQRIWEFALQQGLDDIAEPITLDRHSINAVRRAVQRVRSVTGLSAKLNGLKQTLRRHAVPRQKRGKSSRPHKADQMGFPDWMENE